MQTRGIIVVCIIVSFTAGLRMRSIFNGTKKFLMLRSPLQRASRSTHGSDPAPAGRSDAHAD
jgi:hypothetical protein